MDLRERPTKILQLAPRDCPLCGRLGRPALHLPANLDRQGWSPQTFSSRKAPEFMHYRLVRCRTCDVIYADPAPAPDALANEYREATYESKDEAVMASRTYGNLVDRVVRRLPDRRGVVDIGTGEGSFLGEMRARGFGEIRGIEPSTASWRRADSEIQDLIRLGVFEPGLFPANSQTLVTCFQTLEHLPDPLGVAQEARRILKPGGAFIVVAHNHRSLSSAVLRSRSPIYDVEHLQLFSRRSLGILMSRAGFRSVEVAPISNCYPVSYWARILPWPDQFRPVVSRWIEVSLVGKLRVPLRAGNLVGIGFNSARR